MIRYTDPTSGRSLGIEIVRHLGGAKQFFTYRLLDGVPGRQRSDPFPFFLDAARAALDAARQLCRQPPH